MEDIKTKQKEKKPKLLYTLIHSLYLAFKVRGNSSIAEGVGAMCLCN